MVGSRAWRELILAASLVILTVAVSAASALAQGQWYPLGTGLSPVNHNPAKSAETPSLASVNGNLDTGALYLAWQ
ncbi:MAG: hypothetical protein ACJ764_07410, partial [Solirubrobacteraceae bacterium]